MGKTKKELENEIVTLRVQQNKIIEVMKSMDKNIRALSELVLDA